MIRKRVFTGLLVCAVSAGLLFWLLPLPGQIPVLNYHFVVPPAQVGPTSLDVSTEAFQEEMAFLKRFRYRILTLDQLSGIKHGKRKPKGREIAITFDDGNQSYLDFVLPILKPLGIPSTNFVIWNNVMHEEHGSMDRKGLAKIAAEPLVTVASHSLSHAVLPNIEDGQKRKEIFESKHLFETFLNRPVLYFSYPTGQFDAASLGFVREAGYDLAFTTSWKRIPKGEKETLYSLTRIKIVPRDNLFLFWLKLSGLYGMVQRFCHQSF